jgi:hypothetical protein
VLFDKIIRKLGVSSWHWSNENEKSNGKLGSGFRHGRAWFNFGGNDEEGAYRPPVAVVRAEWHHGRNNATATIDIDPDEREILLAFGLPGFSYYLGIGGIPKWFLDRLPLAYRRRGAAPRTIGLRIFDSALWWSIWEDQNETDSKDPKWLRGNWRPLDTFFGKIVYTSTVLLSKDVLIPMLEGTYPATVELFLSTWTRPRFPFPPIYQELRRAKIDVPSGVGHPGRGENSYDCGDDATYGLTCQADTVEEAIGKFVASVLKSRQKYGGTHTFAKSVQ